MITWEYYFEQMVKLRVEFQLADAAISGWAHSQEALDKYSADQLEDLQKLFREGEGQNGAWVFSDQQRIKNYVDAIKAEAPDRIPGVMGRLAQHQYILQVTIFESFLKSIHRAILLAQPTLLKHDRHVELGKLISQGSEAIIKAEVEREVQTLDRKDTKDKETYFRDRLGINWFDGTAEPLLAAAVSLRNVILHEDPDRTVTPEDQLILAVSTTAVSFATVAGAAVLYPQVCALPEHLPEQDAGKFVAAARRRQTKPLPPGP
jgi:hypothetical protein